MFDGKLIPSKPRIDDGVNVKEGVVMGCMYVGAKLFM